MKILYSCPINLRGRLFFEDADTLGKIVNIAVIGRPDVNAPNANGVLVTAPWVSKDDEAMLSTAWHNIRMTHGITAVLDVYEDGSTMVRHVSEDELRKISRKFRKDSRKLRK